jgi:hypothetical protein
LFRHLIRHCGAAIGIGGASYDGKREQRNESGSTAFAVTLFAGLVATGVVFACSLVVAIF